MLDSYGNLQGDGAESSNNDRDEERQAGHLHSTRALLLIILSWGGGWSRDSGGGAVSVWNAGWAGGASSSSVGVVDDSEDLSRSVLWSNGEDLDDTAWRVGGDLSRRSYASLGNQGDLG